MKGFVEKTERENLEFLTATTMTRVMMMITVMLK